MDTMKILLGATVALLLGALGMSYSNMKQGVGDPKAEEERVSREVARFNLDIEKLRLEVEKLKLEKEQPVAAAPVAPPVAAGPSQEELAALQAENARLAEEKTKADRKAKVSDQENVLLARRELESHDAEMRRARLISQAILVGVVSEYQENPQTGNFVVMDVPEDKRSMVQPGTILAVRKNSGLLGRLRVTTVEAGSVVADVLAGDVPFQPQVGDELIIPPPF